MLEVKYNFCFYLYVKVEGYYDLINKLVVDICIVVLMAWFVTASIFEGLLGQYRYFNYNLHCSSYTH